MKIGERRRADYSCLDSGPRNTVVTPAVPVRSLGEGGELVPALIKASYSTDRHHVAKGARNRAFRVSVAEVYFPHES